jgi:Protein of unknown function (DUF3037)
MPEENRKTLHYRVLRYTPNLVRDEWVNIGVLLEEADGPRREARLIQEPGEMARVRRLHPAADEELLRSLPVEFDARLGEPSEDVRKYLDKLELTLSNVLQFSPQRALLAEDFDAEMDRLYRDYVTPPARTRVGVVESTRAWIRERLRDVFRRHRLSAKLEKNIRVEEYTQPGDPLKLDYGYQNGVRGYMHSIVLGRDLAQAKVLAYTAECVRARVPGCEFTAITEIEPARDNPRHQFMAKVFEDQDIAIVSLNRIERFADDLRRRLQ